ncbi:MAG: NADH-quinone oxidoreductase subunit H [Bacteroidota bacterium]|nr:NADH-quinone oxidoreductase subunit H [Bacteroidota bacterium]
MASLALTTLVYCAVPLLFILVYGLIAILGEMKISAWVQDRLGPMRTGPKGTLQPIADILKLLQKEDTMPLVADKAMYRLAPWMIFLASYAAFAALPFSVAYVGARLNTGIFYFISIGSLAVISILMAGWGSNNKYSMLGAMRSVAQIISYEIPVALAILTIVVVAGSMDLQTITNLQAGGIQNWFLFGGPKHLPGFGGMSNLALIPVMLIAFAVYFVGSLAETNRVPFDVPEAESELVAGYHTEYSGMKFALFFLAEYASMFAVGAVASVLFLGGWQSPFGGSSIVGDANGPLIGFGWFVLKGLSFVFVQIWIRWTLPRLRVDQVMHICWKVLIPFSLVAVLAASTLSVVLQ